jgi:hypothetical protein
LEGRQLTIVGPIVRWAIVVVVNGGLVVGVKTSFCKIVGANKDIGPTRPLHYVDLGMEGVLPDRMINNTSIDAPGE